MRVVTRHAGFEGIVHHGIDLGKPGRAGRVVSVAQGAEAALPRSRELYFVGVLRVSGPGTVANLTRHAAVVRGQALLGDLIMTVRTLPVPRIALLTGYDRGDGCRPIMTDVAEGVGDQVMPRHHEPHHQHGEQHSQARNLLRHVVGFAEGVGEGSRSAIPGPVARTQRTKKVGSGATGRL
jgi:hypothetical protein